MCKNIGTKQNTQGFSPWRHLQEEENIKAREIHVAVARTKRKKDELSLSGRGDENEIHEYLERG